MTDLADIRAVTEWCPRPDCSVETGMTARTLMGWEPTYDRDGNRTDGGDPNIVTTSYACLTCGATWVTRRRDGESPSTVLTRPGDVGAGV